MSESPTIVRAEIATRAAVLSDTEWTLQTRSTDQDALQWEYMRDATGCVELLVGRTEALRNVRLLRARRKKNTAYRAIELHAAYASRNIIGYYAANTIPLRALHYGDTKAQTNQCRN